ncbi:MAG: MFS transporter [Chloroflexia bacterium]
MSDTIEVTAVPASTGPGALWRNRDYVLLWSGQVVSTLGSTASGIVFPLLILAITGSAVAAGIAGALQTIPYVIFSLPAGALIDRWDRKRVMILCDVGRGVAFTSIPVAVLLDSLTLWHLYVVAFIEGTLFVFFNIAEVAALPRVVPKSQIPDATALNQAAFGVAGIAGPSIGTFLYQTVGRMAPFVADAVSYFVSVGSLFAIRTRFQTERAAPKEDRHLGREIMEGLRWVWAQPVVRFMAFDAGITNLVFAGLALVLIVLARQMGAPDGSIGLIFSIGSVGAILGSLAGGRLSRRFTFGQIVIWTGWVQALLYPLYILAPNILVLGAISAVIFMVVPIASVAILSYRASLIPDELQGRVNSSVRLVAFGFQPLGSLLAGFLIERFGVEYAIATFSTCLIALAVAVTLNRNIREARIDRGE